MSQVQVNLKEKTIEELKVLAWDLRNLIEGYNSAYQAVVQELNTKQKDAAEKAQVTEEAVVV
jgi:uncharacterized coiled-coil protein SlyX